jgi:ferredoxin--NADP+ reductase
MDPFSGKNVAVVGAGPAGLFAARELALWGVNVLLFNRDIKPGGLAEYGIYPDKIKMKIGLRNQFQQFIAMPGITYQGFVNIGETSDLSLQQLREIGFQAILVTAGAQGTKSLRLPGEELNGVYHAKDVVYHYNKLPPYSLKTFSFGQRAAIIGVGNVMMDIARYLISECKLSEVIAIARRGPAEVKFDRKELETIGAHLDIQDFESEVERVAPIMRALNQKPQDALNFVKETAPKGIPLDSPTHFRLRFLASPVRIIDKGNNCVGGLLLEENTLTLAGTETKARGLGSFTRMDVDSVIFAIGDRVDEQLGLPVHHFAFDKNPAPRFPVEGQSFEAFDSDKGESIEGVFVAGWSREASKGLVGLARKDGVNGANAVLQYLQTIANESPDVLNHLQGVLNGLSHPTVNRDHLKLLAKAEETRRIQLGVEDFIFDNNEEMLAEMGLFN